MTQDVTYHAEAAVGVSLFVKRGTTDFTMVQCVADDVADIGVTHQGTQDTQLPGASAPFIAAAIDTSCKVYMEGKTCEIIIGAVIAAGDKLKPNAAGQAIKALTGEEYSAIANGAGALIGERVSCTVRYGTLP